MHALIVDDSLAIRMVVGRIMKDLGFSVTEAENGQAALDRLADMPAPDLALVDWNMPVMDGLEFVSRARADKRWQRLPIVMITIETDMHRMEQALRAGVNEYVMKPFTRDVIREKLDLLQLGAS